MKNFINTSLIFLVSVTDNAPEGRVFGLDQQTLVGIVVMIINIVVLFGLLTYILYKPVKKVLQERRDSIKSQFEEAEDRQKNAESLISEYENKLANIDEERDQILNEARQQAEEDKKRIIDQAEKEAKKIKKDAVQALETEQRMLRRNTKDYVIELSALLAEQTLKDAVSLEDLDEKFEEGMKKLEETTW